MSTVDGISETTDEREDSALALHWQMAIGFAIGLIGG